MVLAIGLACGPSAAGARGTSAKTSSLALETMSFADAERAGAVGAGCTWLGPHDRAARLSMADDRAAVMRDGAVVLLRPAAGAKPLFLTYDRWIGDGISILVRDSGRVVRRGRESSETAASLALKVEGRTRTWQGRLDCGS